MFVIMLLLSYQILVAYSLEKIFEEELLENRQAARELREIQRQLNVFNERIERNHRLAIVLPLHRNEFSTSHSDEVVTPPPSYDVLTPPPTFEEASDGFSFQLKTCQ